MPFVAPVPLGLEVMTFARLRKTAPPGRLSKPLRPTFHSLLLVTGGETIHTLDFVDYRLGPGSGLWVRPGQVQRFGNDRATGELVLFEEDFLIPNTLAAALADDPLGPAMADGSTSTRATRGEMRRGLRREYLSIARERAPAAARVETLRHLLSALVLSLGAPGRQEGGRGAQATVVRRFRDLIERDFQVAHNVDHYARELGYSPRTLERASQAINDETPKQAINRRIVLEARRLLAYTNRPVSAIGRELGFRDPSNFSTFFARECGESPAAFRRGAAGAG